MNPKTGNPVRPDETMCNDNDVLAAAAGEEETVEADDEESVNKPEIDVPPPEPAEMNDNGVRVPFTRRAPAAPSEQEKLDHERLHVPFRSWCPHCFAGAAKASPHPTTMTEEDRAIPGYHVD